MTTSIETRIRPEDSPRGSVEFEALLDELHKLSHPACPDVDWFKVEQLCLTLFRRYGAQLQTVAYYTLARSRLYGLPGMAQGVELIETLVRSGSNPCPSQASARAEILAWLFTQLQPLLRSLAVSASVLPELAHLNTTIERLHEILLTQSQGPVIALQALHQQLGRSMTRLEKNACADSPPHLTEELRSRVSVSPSLAMPVILLPTAVTAQVCAAPARRRRRRIILWIFIVTMIAASIGLSFRWTWLNRLVGDGYSALAGGLQTQHISADPVHLDSLLLFDAGSAKLKAGSTKVLINALASIKARPDWLIVITGHSDGTGDAKQNLQLSRARAAAVRDWMQGMGDLPEKCFAVRGAAASEPAASNASADGRAANRRVDIRLVPQIGACVQ